MNEPAEAPSRWTDIERDAARLVASLVGVAFLIGGLTMLFVPGPGMLATTIGLAILATQFTWAKHLLVRTEGAARAAVVDINTDRRARIVLAISGGAMLLGGALAAFIAPSWRVVGAFVAISGLVSLVILLPPVQARLRASLDADNTPSIDGTSTAHPPD